MNEKDSSSSKCKRLLAAAAEEVLGILRTEDLHDIATAALIAGCDSPSLRVLAGSNGADAADLRLLFEKTVAELRLPMPTVREAVLSLARDIAAQMLEGNVGPYQGSERIWDLTLVNPEETFPQLDTFVYGASEWKGRPEDRNIFVEGILEAAKQLVDGTL